MIAEPVESSGGVIVPPEGYWQKVKEHCQKRGMLFIFDEAQTAFGRLGRDFAFQHFEVELSALLEPLRFEQPPLPVELIVPFFQLELHPLDRLAALRPQEIQVGILKRLRGTPIVRHDEAFAMIYSPSAPYEVLQTRDMDLPTLQRMRRFSRYWDLVANSGNFIATTQLLCESGSAFARFLELSDWLFERVGQTHGIALQQLAELLMRFIISRLNVREQRAAEVIWSDYQRAGRSDRPRFLASFIPRSDTRRPLSREEASDAPAAIRVPARQRRHLRADR